MEPFSKAPATHHQADQLDPHGSALGSPFELHFLTLAHRGVRLLFERNHRARVTAADRRFGSTSGTVLIPLSRQRIFLWALLSALALFVGVGQAGAKSNPRAASLKASVPASMARGSVLTVIASGYSGRYDAVSWSSEQGASSGCGGPNSSTISMVAVPRGHTFKVKLTNIVGAPGTLTVCVYLFNSGAHANDTKGHYLVTSRRVKVS